MSDFNCDWLIGKSVLVGGAGVSGHATALALAKLGACVTVTDANASQLDALADADVTTALDLTEPPTGTELVVVSSGWRPNTPLVVAARSAGIEVIGEVELAWRVDQSRVSGPRDWLVVTGTNGKTTTVSMLESIVQAAGMTTRACGNIGLPVIDAVFAGYQPLVVELSSFQLWWSPSVRPRIGALLNVAEDHLEWHESFDDYVRAKARVLTGSTAIGGIDDSLVARLLVESPAQEKIGVTYGSPANGQLGVVDDHLVDRRSLGTEVVLAKVPEIRPPGKPGVIDALTAAATARAYGISAGAVRDGLRAFVPLEHIASLVAEVGGVRYINDTKASNPHAAVASLLNYDRVVWIAGGVIKGTPVDQLVVDVATRLVGVVLIGVDQDMIAAALARHAPNVPVHMVLERDHKAMGLAIQAAREMAQPGDVVLLAPAAASKDMFTDYYQRGQLFADEVRKISQNNVETR